MSNPIDELKNKWEHREIAVTEILKKHDIKDPACGFSVGMGWLPTVDKCLGEMINLGWDKDLHQVKSKFCGLRIYIGEGSDAVHDCIDRAESVCAVSCEDCGKPHGLSVPRSGIALCEDCKKAGKYVS